MLSKLGVADHTFAQAWCLALIVGLVTTALTALTGSADWLSITRGTELWKTATAHMIAMLSATVCFLIARAPRAAGDTGGLTRAARRRG